MKARTFMPFSEIVSGILISTPLLAIPIWFWRMRPEKSAYSFLHQMILYSFCLLVSLGIVMMAEWAGEAWLDSIAIQDTEKLPVIKSYGIGILFMTGSLCLLMARRISFNRQWIPNLFLFIAFQCFAMVIPYWISRMDGSPVYTTELSTAAGLNDSVSSLISVASVILLILSVVAYTERMTRSEDILPINANKELDTAIIH